MTDITPLIKSNQMVVQSYGPGGFKVSGTIYGTPIVVLPDRVVAWDGQDFDALLFLKDETDVVLLGTGRTLVMPPKNKKPQGLHLEAMDTGAACRTYNALMADGRRVAAVLTIPA